VGIVAFLNDYIRPRWLLENPPATELKI